MFFVGFENIYFSSQVEEAAKLAAEYNRQLNQERREQRNSYFDIQTFTVHKPKTGQSHSFIDYISPPNFSPSLPPCVPPIFF